MFGLSIITAVLNEHLVSYYLTFVFNVTVLTIRTKTRYTNRQCSVMFSVACFLWFLITPPLLLYVNIIYFKIPVPYHLIILYYLFICLQLYLNLQSKICVPGFRTMDTLLAQTCRKATMRTLPDGTSTSKHLSKSADKGGKPHSRTHTTTPVLYIDSHFKYVKKPSIKCRRSEIDHLSYFLQVFLLHKKILTPCPAPLGEFCLCHYPD